MCSFFAFLVWSLRSGTSLFQTILLGKQMGRTGRYGQWWHSHLSHSLRDRAHMVSHVHLCVYGCELKTVHRFLDGVGDGECPYSVNARYSQWSSASTGIHFEIFWAFIRNVSVCNVDTTSWADGWGQCRLLYHDDRRCDRHSIHSHATQKITAFGYKWRHPSTLKLSCKTYRGNHHDVVL